MADPYVIFPGTSDHIATPDVNLLDADSAHQQQGVGIITQAGSALVGQSIDTPTAPPPFGTKAMKWTASGVNSFYRIGVSIGVTDAPPVVPGQSYTFMVSMMTEASGVEAHAELNWLDAGGAWAGGVAGSTAPEALTPGVWKAYRVEGVAPAGGAQVSVGGRASTAVSGDVIWMAALMVADGDLDEFVPSLRIVSTLYEETLPADMPIVFVADGTPLTIGDGWAGNGTSYARYDGPDASAPVVASFQAGDVPVAAQLPA